MDMNVLIEKNITLSSDSFNIETTITQKDIKIFSDNDDHYKYNNNNYKARSPSHLLNEESSNMIINNPVRYDEINDDEYDLQKIKKEALDVHHLQYSFKEETPFDIIDENNHDMIFENENDFNITKDDNFPVLKVPPLFSKIDQNNEFLLNDNNGDDNDVHINNETNTNHDNVDVSPIFKEHNYMTLDLTSSTLSSSSVLMDKKAVVTDETASMTDKFNINNKNELKLHLKSIEEFFNNKLNDDHTDNNNDNKNVNKFVDKEIFGFITNLFKQLIIFNNKYKNQVVNINESVNGKDNETIIQSNLQVLFEACEMRDDEIQFCSNKSNNTIMKNKREIENEFINDRNDQLQKNEKPIRRSEEKENENQYKFKIKSEIKCENTPLSYTKNPDDNHDDDGDTLSSLPSIPEFNDKNQNEDEAESTKENQQENINTTAKEDVQNDLKIFQNNLEDMEDTENVTMAYLENRSEPLEYYGSDLNNTENSDKSEIATMITTNVVTPNESCSGVDEDNLEFQKNVEKLKNFIKKLQEDCPIKPNPDPLSPIYFENKINEFVMTKFLELKELAKRFKISNPKEIGIQTEIEIDNEILKERQKKKNEKTKRRLLLSSGESDVSDSSSDDNYDDEEDYDHILSDNQNELVEKESQDYLSLKINCDIDEEDNDNQEAIIVEENKNLNDNISDVPESKNDNNESDIGTEPYLIGGIDLSKCIMRTEETICNDGGKKNGENNAQVNDAKSVEKSDDDNVMHYDTDDDEIKCFDKESVQSACKISETIINDEKLKIQPIVRLNKLSEEDLENYFDKLRDKEIDRLLDFRSLLNPKTSHPQYVKKKKDEKKNKKVEDFIEISNVSEEEESSSDDSSSKNEEKLITEKEYLEMFNNNLKKQLLNSSTSSSDDTTDTDDAFDVEQNIEAHDNLSSNDESDDSEEQLVDKFLKKYQSEIRNVMAEEKKIGGNNDEKKSDSVSEEVPELRNLNDNEDKDHVQCEFNKENLEEQNLEQKQGMIENSSVKDNRDNELSENNINKDGDNDEKKLASKSTKSHFRDNVYESTRKILKENEFNLEIDANNDNESSDCEILDDVNLSKKRRNRQKSVETLVAEAELRKNKSSNSNKNDDLINLSSSSESELEEISSVKDDDEKEKRIPKPMLRQDQLAGETRLAQKQEAERIRRLDKKQKLMKDALEKAGIDPTLTTDVILDYNPDTKTFIKVHSDIVKLLKPHQIDGVKFLYDSCYGSVKDLKNYPGSGCILAHCMGLGKTFQLVALLHTVISYKELQTSKILILCPKSTVMNWCDEIRHWLHPFKKNNVKLYSFPDTSDIQMKLRTLEEWSLCGTPGLRRPGVFLIGYEAFRTLVFYHSYKKKGIHLTAKQKEAIEQKVKKYLLEPGADLVICDEGHIIKNRKAAISAAVSQIKTPRRIILTGTPIQNNLKEYYSMVNFIKPSFLGTEREFANLYANPIKNGQHKDSSRRDIKIMKQRSFVLHKKLSKFVQRREAALLKTFLPKKFEYVLFIPMTEVQNTLYKYFLNTISHRQGSKGKSLIPDYTCLRKIWTHPKVLEIAWQNAISSSEKNKKEVQLPKVPTTLTTINSDDELPDDVYDSQTGELSVTNDWWRPLVKQEDLETLLPSNKLITMFEILRMCEENNEKCLIFSAFVAVLNVVEYFMQQIHQQNHEFLNNSGIEKFKGPWIPNQDYYRLDGKTSKTLRHGLVKQFNDPQNTRTRCFLISAKAGGQGINLVGANRVIILDTSWNPSNDQQNIFRIYRLGQGKKCYVYRLLSMGTMEEKVYSRSVTKQAMSFRVVDEQQIDRHYSMAELTELYTLTEPNYTERPVPVLPQDNILASLLRNYPNLIYKYHEHDSLLENKMEQELSEEEKAEAWLQYERDLTLSQEPPFSTFESQGTPYNSIRGGYTQGSYPIPYGLSTLSSLTGLNYPPNPMFNLYNMYQNFPNYSTLMSGINHQSSVSSLSALQNSYLSSFMQPSSSVGNNLSTSNLLSPPTSNEMAINNLGPLPFNPLNATSQRSSYMTTPSSSSFSTTNGLYPPLISNSTSNTNNGDSFFSDLRKLLESPSNPPTIPPLLPYGGMPPPSSPSSTLTSRNLQCTTSPPQLSPITSSAQNKTSSALALTTSTLSTLSTTVTSASSLSSLDIMPTTIKKPNISSSSSLSSPFTDVNSITTNSVVSIHEIPKTVSSNLNPNKKADDILSTNISDQNNKSKRNGIGIMYLDKPSSTSSNSNIWSSSSSTTTSSVLSTTPTTHQKSPVKSIRTVNMINENGSNKNSTVSTSLSSLFNNNNTTNSTRTSYQRSKSIVEKESKNQKEKLVESNSRPYPVQISNRITTASPVQQKTKSPSGKQFIVNTSSGTMTIAKSIVGAKNQNSINSLDGSISLSMPRSTGQSVVGNGTGTDKSAILSSSSSPSLTVTNRSSLSSTLNTKNTNSANSNKAPTTQQQNKVSPTNSKMQTVVVQSSASSTLSEMIKVAVSDGKTSSSSPSTVPQSIRNTNNSRPSLSITNTSVNNQQLSKTKTQSTSNLNKLGTSGGVITNKRVDMNISNNKNKTILKNFTPAEINKIISSNNNATNSNRKNNTITNNNLVSTANQSINVTNKSALNSLNNRSDISVRPIDPITSLRTSVISAKTPLKSSNATGNGSGVLKTPVIAKVTSLNQEHLNHKPVNSLKNTSAVLSRKRPATTNLIDDALISVRQIKKVKKSTNAFSPTTSTTSMSGGTFLKTNQVVSVYPKPLAKPQTSQVTLQRVKEGKKQQEVVEID